METADLFRRLVVVDDVEVMLLEVGDVPAVLVGHGEDHIDFVGADLESRNLVGAGGGIRTLPLWRGGVGGRGGRGLCQCQARKQEEEGSRSLA